MKKYIGKTERRSIFHSPPMGSGPARTGLTSALFVLKGRNDRKEHIEDTHKKNETPESPHDLSGVNQEDKMRNKNSSLYFRISANVLKILTEKGKVMQNEKIISGQFLGLVFGHKKQSPWASICPGATVGVNKSEEVDSNLCLK